MKIVHHLDSHTICAQEVREDVGFLLTNKQGGYLWLESEPRSRYQGWFFAPAHTVGKRIFKIIENIELPGAPAVTEMHNAFWRVKRRREHITENFFYPYYSNALVYEVSEPLPIEVVLDVKESYNNSEFGRFYTVAVKQNFAVVSFRDERASCPPLYLAVVVDGGDIEELNQWIPRFYSFDKERNSPPYERYVFKALRLRAKRVVFSVSEEHDRALAQARYIADRIPLLETYQKKEVLSLKPKFAIQNTEVAMAHFCSRYALSNLVVSPFVQEDESRGGLYAGLPWFFQFWKRDEAISLNALASILEHDAKEMSLKAFSSINEGVIDGSADAALWFFKRAGDFVKEKRYTARETGEIKRYAEDAIYSLLKGYTEDDFALTGSHKTWMDSCERGGARLEIQTLRLALYNLAARLNGFSRKRRYSELEERLKNKVRRVFWNGKFFADGVDVKTGAVDSTITPNIFLAAYVYPELLRMSEWITCFDTVIQKLWLTWGGFATVDRESPSFHLYHTGEVADSYHRGDSWFWVNNLAALVLHRFDKIRYKEYIDKIVQASTEEILWHGIVGYHAELSSAAFLAGEGCLAQSWSNALYGELAEGIGKGKFFLNTLLEELKSFYIINQ